MLRFGSDPLSSETVFKRKQEESSVVSEFWSCRPNWGWGGSQALGSKLPKKDPAVPPGGMLRKPVFMLSTGRLGLSLRALGKGRDRVAGVTCCCFLSAFHMIVYLLK